MKKKDENTENAIMHAAIEEFLSKGYSRAKTTEIAKRAGVNHAMLHYYFRTKENLFNMVFQQKVEVMANSFADVFDRDLPFFEKITLGIEKHFDLMAEDPRLPFFVYSEIIVNDDRKNVFVTSFYPRISRILDNLQIDIKREIQKGTICVVEPIDLIINIVSLNVFAFLAQPFLSLLSEQRGLDYTQILERRKENNVRVILKSLKA